VSVQEKGLAVLEEGRGGKNGERGIAQKPGSETRGKGTTAKSYSVSLN